VSNQPRMEVCSDHPELGKQLVVEHKSKNPEIEPNSLFLIECAGCKIEAGDTREKKSDDQSWR
jgi:hypothetical protein